MDTVRRFVFLHHRLLAAICAGLAVLAALGALRQTPEGVRVVVARDDLASGHVIDESDVRVALLSSAPDHALRLSEAVGRRVAGPMRAGEPVTDYRVLRPDALDGYGDDAVLTSVLVSDVGGLTGVQVGDRIDVIAVDPHGEAKASCGGACRRDRHGSAPGRARRRTGGHRDDGEARPRPRVGGPRVAVHGDAVVLSRR